MRRVNRTPEEEEAFQLARRQRNVENARRRRAAARDNIIQEIRLQRTENNNTSKEHYIGQMNELCIHCQAKHFAAEKVTNKGNSFNDCCSHGTVIIDYPEFPDVLKSYFLNTHENSNDFFSRIRIYNNLLSFASFNANLVKFEQNRPAPYCFKVHGQIYYQINRALYPGENETPSFGQLYIIDPDTALDARKTQVNSLEDEKFNDDTMTKLDEIIRKYNIHAQTYNMMKKEIELQKMLNIQNNINKEPEMQLLFTLNAGADNRRYNYQQTNEIAAIFSMTSDGEISESFVTIRNIHTKDLKTISCMSPYVEPWIYPLLYPKGTLGWNSNMQRIGSNRRITRNAYIKYLITNRDNQFNQFILGRRLYQQWLVDNYIKMERDRITYLRNNQKQLRVESYAGLMDHLQKRANENNCNVRKIVILPSTFIGSPRHMAQNYQDAMSIVRKYGKPDIFLTMTCNPGWKEIQENLLPGQNASDRPELCARVFDIKKNDLLTLVTKTPFFGSVAAHVHVIEFQKRGLPHMHLLITLKEPSKLRIPADIDKHISAEILNPVTDKHLYDIVTKQMIHSCGQWCMVDGKCSKHFPAQFQDETVIHEDGYIIYQRRNNGITFSGTNNRIFDNRHVVPYNPELLRTYNCHINVVAVTSIKSVKYLYKYIYKGHDAAKITIQEPSQENSENSGNSDKVIDNDEIKNFIETRYIGPVEAVYRILNKPLQDKSHGVKRLPVHLPNQQTITIGDNTNEEALISALQKSSMLTDYFALNQRDIEARKYLYSEIPLHYTFERNKMWEKRQRHTDVVARMYSVNPSNLELFHLRILLLHVRGATSFEKLREVNGIILETFTEACIALGLIENDFEWDKALQEGANWMMPQSLRNLFVRILIHCQPLYPEQLWEKYKDLMSEDFSRDNNLLLAHKKAYADISKKLKEEGHSLSEFPSMSQEDNFNENISENFTNEQFTNLGEEQYKLLNSEQKKVVDDILEAINSDNPSTNCFFINGPGGSGKTFIYSTLSNLLRGKKKFVCSMAFTGIAATLLYLGRTLHKIIGLPVPLLPDSSSNIKYQSKQGQYLRDVDVFIWDEAPMAPKYALDIINRTLQDLMNNNLPFGGKIMILGGDFRQLLPVLPHGNRSETVSLSIKYSNSWKHFKTYELTKNMRTLPEEVDFAKFLIDIGNETINDNNDYVELPSDCMAINENIGKSIFGKLISEKNWSDLATTAILSARNADVDKINKQVVDLLDDSDEKVYTSIDSVDNCENENITELLLPEYLNALHPTGLPPHELHLRKHCIIMLIRNLNINEGLCNGTRLLVLDLQTNLLKCKVLTGDKNGDIVFINRITLYCDNEYPFTFKRRQFPVKIAFAMTINKAQGQTFKTIGLDLVRDVFTHGQLYVAMSRVRSWDSLKIFENDKTNLKIKNHVFKELYQ